MAIFDLSDGSVDPRPRCTGHCCRCFSLEKPLADVKRDDSIPDRETILDMLIPLGVVRGQEIFTCKFLGKTGDCTIYQRRPKMCRDFPGPNPCTYKNCSSHGPQAPWKRLYNWLTT